MNTKTLTGLPSDPRCCSKCGVTKPASQIKITTRGHGGVPRYHSWCQDCFRAHARAYAAKRYAQRGES